LFLLPIGSILSLFLRAARILEGCPESSSLPNNRTHPLIDEAAVRAHGVPAIFKESRRFYIKG
jgi:hypothetical protein